jgi:predicted RNA binding protein YcfA (HicA-like mRNA interferase family)
LNRSVPKELRKVAQVARRSGWEVSQAKSGHLQWKHPDGTTTVRSSLTASDKNAAQNTIKDLRRAGLVI